MTAGGLRLHVRQRLVATPAGPSWVLVHGLAVSHRYLMPTAHPLAARHPVVVPDLPGFGLSDKPPTALDVTEHAAVLSGRRRVCITADQAGIHDAPLVEGEAFHTTICNFGSTIVSRNWRHRRSAAGRGPAGDERLRVSEGATPSGA